MAYSLVSLGLDFAQMVLAVRKHLQMTNNIRIDNFYYYNFLRKLILGEVLVLHLDVLIAGLGLDGPPCPEIPQSNPVNHPQQVLVQQLCPEINFWGCPGSGPPGTCRRLPR